MSFCSSVSARIVPALLVVSLSALLSCSSEDDAVKLEVALSAGPLKVSADSSGKIVFDAIEQFELDVYDLGDGIQTAEERLAEEERANNWYVIFQHGSEETVFEFEPNGFMQVKLDGKVVQELRMRTTVVKLEAGATAEITAIAHFSESGDGVVAVPELLLPATFVGTWRGEVSYVERRNPFGKGYTQPPRPVTVVIPTQQMQMRTGADGASDKIVGTADLPRDDFHVDFGPDDVENVDRPAKALSYTLAEWTRRPITLSRVYVEEVAADSKIGSGGRLVSFTVLTDGKLFMERYEGEAYLRNLKYAALLTKVG